MLNGKIFGILLALLLIAAAVFGQSISGLKVAREIAEAVAAGQTVDVKLNIKLGTESPSGIILVEKIPEGWQVVSSNPKGSVVKGELKWLIYSKEMSNKTVMYTLKAPANFKEPVFLSGGWQTLSENGIVEGDFLLDVKKPEEPKEEAPTAVEKPQEKPSDNTLLYVAGGVIVLLLIAVAYLSGTRKK